MESQLWEDWSTQSRRLRVVNGVVEKVLADRKRIHGDQKEMVLH